MIHQLTLTDFRGIRAGTLGDFAPLTVLVGPNGCGKSTVLDALLLGATQRPLDAFARILGRRPEVEDQARRGDRLRAPSDRGGPSMSPTTGMTWSVVVCDRMGDAWRVAQDLAR
jgi:hypothetical protein